MTYFALSRRFRDLTQAELEEPELLASFNDRSWKWADGWAELLQHPRVLLLAEAGSGKTVEMRAQAVRLSAEGKPAFFIPLESLHYDALSGILSAAEEQAFAAWKVNDQSTAWFFLDAVDELKLTDGKLERALGRLAKEIDGLLHRAHIVISCRPHDWRPSVDMATVNAKLPITQVKSLDLEDSDAAFLAAIEKSEGGRTGHVDASAKMDGLKVVVLLPLSAQQIEALARHLGVADPTAFIAEIRRQNAWTFARRPLDLSELVTLWLTHGRLGTRAQQHAANIAVKLKDPDRPDHGVLPDDKARTGAERLALALTLTHTRTIRSPEQALNVERAEGVLDAAKILTDWKEDERQSLLRRGLFDPATYGRIRFHHRSVQEYLAACRLHALRKKGMPVKSLLRLLFAEQYGEQVVIPSMQAVSAWLALWDEDVRRELMKREPETLLSMGDPESLPIEARAHLLRSFAKAYGEGGWRGLQIPFGEVRRLAHPELANVVQEIWDAGHHSPDVRELLLDLVEQGPIVGCLDIARAVALDTGQPDNLRTTAIRAVVACGRSEAMDQLKDSILHEPTKWPDHVIHEAADDLFPSVLSIDELIELIHRTKEPENGVAGFSWALIQVVDKVEPSSKLASDLREALTHLVWSSRYENLEWYQPRARFDYIAPALARLCDRQLEAGTSPFVDNLIWASVVANRFGAHVTASSDIFRNLRHHFEHLLDLRRAAFWNEIKLISEISPADTTSERCSNAEHNSLVVLLRPEDRPWLQEDLHSSTRVQREVSLHALTRLWIQNGRDQGELEQLFATVQSDPILVMELNQLSTPPEPDPTIERWKRRQRRRAIVHEGRKRQFREKWNQWKLDLKADLTQAFSEEGLPTTRRNLHKWLELNKSSQGRYDVWDESALRNAFGTNVAMQAAKAFRALWRAYSPIPRGQRPMEDRDKVLRVWIEGLAGLSAESMTPGWATYLSQDEARIAAAYATIEINGFPNWLNDLAKDHPAAVDEVIGGELTAELATEITPYLRSLQNLSHADVNLKKLLAPRLLPWLSIWPSRFQDKNSGEQSAHHLGQVISILCDVIEDQDRENLATICDRQFFANPNSPVALTWLRGLFLFNPARATQILVNILGALSEPEATLCAIEMFASLLGGRSTTFDFIDGSKRAQILGILVQFSFRYIRLEEDQKHEGAYTPDTRDHAERARDFLLITLLDIPGVEAHNVGLELAADPVFGEFSDRLRLLIRQRAAKDAENPPMSPEHVVAFEERAELLPNDRDGLFNIMLDRLDDLAHDIRHHDLTDRLTLRKIHDEAEMQRTLALRLRYMAKDAYVVTREDEVADSKRTDIRLVAMHGEQRAVIEVKLADKRWSLTDLEQALRNQLVGQYLRHNTCQAGCLLLTYDGTKKRWRHPVRKTYLSFLEVAEHLSALAEIIEQELRHTVRLAVVPLDLTDPL
ncbi:MAG TPA: hypothetical protein VF789_29320 [Thermoanaerobaculia bacterium]